MKFRMNYALLAAMLVLVCLASAAQQPTIGFEGAQWIWHTPTAGEAPGAFHAGIRYFRNELSLPESPSLVSAKLIVTCDNLFVLYVNGQPVGEGNADNNAWNHPKHYDLTSLLSPGRAVFAVEAINTLPGPSGLLLKFVATLENGQEIVLVSDNAWKSTATETANWEHADFDDQKWEAALNMGDYGTAPWHKVTPPPTPETDPAPVGKVHQVAEKISASAYTNTVLQKEATEEFAWPEGVVYVSDDCSLYRPAANTGKSADDSLSVTIFNPRKSRAFPEHDLPAPMKVGHTLMLLKPAAKGAVPRVLVDAGKGAVGSPSVSFDGKWIYFSMVREGEAFFHLYKISADGGTPVQLTDGPFFDIDPAELPDGRIVFTSTRIGTFEEYHSPPSRALYVMNADGTDIHTITNTIIFDNEPEVLADGRIIFIRSDNFFDRGKVETLLHATLPDGTHGYTEFGLDNGPEYGVRLRSYYCGSPAPMPDGRVAYISSPGITIGNMGESSQQFQHITLEAGDVAALPDGRLLCTVAQRASKEQGGGLLYASISVLDPDARPPVLTKIFDASGEALHSPVYLGARTKPPLRPQQVIPPKEEEQATGFLFCQDARFTKNNTAGWDQVRAIRVLAGTGLTTRSSHAYIVHAGNETVELGTVPIAPDGSFFIEVPADTPIALQAVDAEGRAELNEMSWIYVRPGERRSCVGCHQPRQSAPLAAPARAMAIKIPALQLLGKGEPHRFRGNNPAVTGLMELQADRFREVAGINRHSETEDPMDTRQDEINRLIKQLRRGDPDLKISAAQRLAIFRSPKATSALADCLKDAHREVRVAATIALATCGNRDAVPPLLDALSDEDPLVAQGAIIALENLTGHRESYAYSVFDDDPQAAVKAWRTWFAGTSWDAIEEDLIQRIETGDLDSIRRAAVALGHIGGPASHAALRNYVAKEESNNPYPEWRKAGHTSDNARFNALSPINPRTLQAATRAIGYTQDRDAVPMLSKLLKEHSDPRTGNLFLAEAAVEALGEIGTPEAETALIEIFSKLKDYNEFTLWYGDHPALMSCHASPIHYFILEALDAMASTNAHRIVPDIIRSVPIDPDRALLLPNDDYEALTGRVLRRQHNGIAVIETCLAILGDEEAKASPKIKKAIATVIRCWGGHPGPENRAAQILSLTCSDQAYAARIEAALLRYCTMDSGIERVFNTGIPEVDKLPVENWVSFYLARGLGNLEHPQSAAPLIEILEGAPAEAASGRPDPLGPGVLFLHNGLTPCWRAAVAWALGRIGDPQAVPVLLNIVQDLENATDTRHAAAVALGRIGDADTLVTLRELAVDYPEKSTQKALLAASLRDE